MDFEIVAGLADECLFVGVAVAPVNEQRVIARRIGKAFAEVDRLSIETSAARKLIDHLDRTILAKAFRGELVPQDPNDEPASALLERIRAEREVRRPTKRAVKK